MTSRAGDSLTASVLAPSFTTLNSVLNGISPSPGQLTGGDGAVTGQLVLFTFDFASPIFLPADHYFFVPQVPVAPGAGNFFWLSASRPIVPPGTPFPAGFTDLQAWIRNANLDPDWSRVGADIVGGGAAFNMAFEIRGAAVPEPATLVLLGSGLMLTRRAARAASSRRS
jgi:PEP-CTERM motif